jgi:hypothetical protein
MIPPIFGQGLKIQRLGWGFTRQRRRCRDGKRDKLAAARLVGCAAKG